MLQTVTKGKLQQIWKTRPRSSALLNISSQESTYRNFWNLLQSSLLHEKENFIENLISAINLNTRAREKII